MMNNIKYTGFTNDKGKRVINGTNGLVKFKLRLDKSEVLSEDEQLKVMNLFSDGIKEPNNIQGLLNIGETKYYSIFKDEIRVVVKSFIKYQEGFKNIEIEEQESENIERYILAGDTGSGKSYLLAGIISEVISKDKNENESRKIKEYINNILTGLGEKTISIYNFEIRSGDQNNIKFKYKLIPEERIKEIAEEIVGDAYDTIKGASEKNKNIKYIIKSEYLGNSFRFKRMIGKSNYDKVNSFLMNYFYKNENIMKNQYIENTSKNIIDIINEHKSERKTELEQYKNIKEMDSKEFIKILEIVSSKEKGSVIEDITFTITSKSVKNNFDITDSIGLNHGEGSKGIDNNKIRTLRMMNLIDQFPNHKIIFTLNSRNTGDPTLNLIDLMDKMGIITKVKFVVTQLDFTNEYNLEEYLEEKINDKLGEELVSKIEKNIVEGPINIDKLKLEKIDSIILENKINNDKFDIDELIAGTIEKTEKDIDNALENIHWNRMNALSRNESLGKDNYCSVEFIFSITNFFVANIFDRLDNDILINLFNVPSNISNKEFDKRKLKFKEKLTNTIRVYYISMSIHLLNKIYMLRWRSEYREYLELSMTKERVAKLENLVKNKNKNKDVLIEIFKLSLN